MFNNNGSKLNFRLGDVIRAAFGLAMVDGGFIIAIQIITFLLNYFGANLQLGDQDGTFAGISKTAFLISIIGMLNLSVIIYRITGLARGMKYSPAICYHQALRRWPILILLYILGSILLLAVMLPLLHFVHGMFNTSLLNYNKLLMFGMLILMPYGILACTFVIDQEKNPLQAVLATLSIIKNKISMRLLLNISMLYSLPFTLGSLITSGHIAPYLGLFNAVWFLFCHILIIVIYAGANVAMNPESSKQKPTKVIIV